MAQDSDTTKFPKPIPNPLSSKKPEVIEEDRTDPNLVRPVPVAASPQQPVAQSNPSTVANTPRMPEMGIIGPLMKDPTITEIMVNDLRNIMVEKDGQLMATTLNFTAIDDLNRLTRAILDITGRILSPENPYVDVMLPDGSRVNIVAPPLTLFGPCITIRKFPTRRFSLQDFINQNSIDQRIGYFLNAIVLGRMNILVAGGTGSGKTTLLGALVATIPKRERMVTIEDTAELTIDQPNHVRMQTKLQTPSSPAITARDLVANALRMRPDRIIIGECRKSEAFDMLQAMNTGHAGSMTTIHANSPRDALFRLETLCLFSGADVPLTALRKQMVSALDVIIQIHRFRDGKRKVVAVSEVTGMEGDTITLQDIFAYDTDPARPGLPEGGGFRSLGLVPSFVDRLREQGIEFPQGFFS